MTSCPERSAPAAWREQNFDRGLCLPQALDSEPASVAAEAEERLQAAVASAQAAVQVESSQSRARGPTGETGVAGVQAGVVAVRETSAQSQAKAADEAV
eukprot:COSAG01_NODE_1091_length_11743_cov_52.449244_1_plen_98_part_10